MKVKVPPAVFAADRIAGDMLWLTLQALIAGVAGAAMLSGMVALMAAVMMKIVFSVRR